MGGIEWASGVADWNEPAREDRQPFKMAQDVIPETMARDLAVGPGALHGVVECRRTQGSGESHETIDIAGWCIAVAFAEAYIERFPSIGHRSAPRALVGDSPPMVNTDFQSEGASLGM